SDSAFYHEKYRRLGGQQPEFLDTQRDDGRFSISVRHTLATDELPLPDFVSKRVGGHLTLHQTDVWQLATRTGRIEIDIESTPLNMGIDLQLVERDAGARLILAFDIHADVPLLGKRIERAVAEPMTRRMRHDLEETARMAPEYQQ